MTYMFASQTSSYAANNGHMFYQYNQMNNDYISQKDIYYTLRHRTLKWVGKFNMCWVATILFLSLGIRHPAIKYLILPY